MKSDAHTNLKNVERLSSSYRRGFYCGYSWVLLLFSAAVVLLVVGAIRAEHHFRLAYEEWLPLLLISIGALCLVAFAWVHFGPRSIPRMRVGVGVWTCASDRWPSTIKELKQALADPEFKKATIVGGGWSNTLQLRRIEGRRIHLGLLKGRVGSDDDMEWLAGTELMHVQEALKAKGMVIPDVPSYGCVTLGAWIVTSGHGMRKRCDSNDWLRSGCVVNVLSRSNPSKEIEPFDLYDTTILKNLLDPNSDYVVASVKFSQSNQRARAFVIDVEVTRELTLFTHEAPKFDKRFLSIVNPGVQGDPPPAAKLEVVFIGGKNCLSIKWGEKEPLAEHPSSAGRLVELSVAYFAYSGSWLGGLDLNKSVKSNSTLQKAVAYFHWKLRAPLLFYNALYPVLNFEVYFYPADDAATITKQTENYRKFCEGVMEFHKRNKGRTEVRAFGRALGLDVFVSSHEKCVSYVQDVLIALLVTHKLVKDGNSIFSCHPGKLRIDELWTERSLSIEFVRLYEFLYVRGRARGS